MSSPQVKVLVGASCAVAATVLLAGAMLPPRHSAPALLAPVSRVGQAELRLFLRGVEVGSERRRVAADFTVVHVRVAAGPGADFTVTHRADAREPFTVVGRRFPWAAPVEGSTSTWREVLPASLLGQAVDADPRQGITATPCAGEVAAGIAARCHLVSGLGWGRSVVWHVADGTVRAAVVPTPLGAIVALASELVDRHDSVLALAARATMREVLPTRGAASEVFAIVGTRVLTMTTADSTGGAIDDAVVVVRDGRIVAVGSRTRTAIPREAERIAGAGLTVLPGLWDMHAHLKQGEWLPAYLASGVTSVRDVGSDAPFLTAARGEIAARHLVAPRIVAAGFVNGRPASGRAHTSAVATTAAEARALVQRYARDGYAEVKLWSALPEDVVQAAIAEAHARGLRVTWHLPAGVPASRAVQLGVDGINHVWPLLGPLGAEQAATAEGKALLASMRRAGTVVDPTLVVAAYQARLASTPLAEMDACARTMPDELVRAWSSFGVQLAALPAARAQLASAMRAVRRLHGAGVIIVAGSDQGLPGCALHHELALYVAAGLRPVEALRTATLHAARAAGVGDEVGTVAVGMRADLVAVRGDPAREIDALREVVFVVRDGVRLEPSALRRRAQLVRANVAGGS